MDESHEKLKTIVSAVLQEFRLQTNLARNVDGLVHPVKLRSLSNEHLALIAEFWLNPKNAEKVFGQILDLGHAAAHALQRRAQEAQRNHERNHWLPVKRYSAALALSGTPRHERIQKVRVFIQANSREAHSV